MTDASLLGSSPWQLPRKSLGFPSGSIVKNPPAKQEMRVRSLGREDALGEGLPTHSRTLACRMPRTEEPGGLPVHRVTKSWTEQRLLSSLVGWGCRKGAAAGVAQLCWCPLVSAPGHAHPSLPVMLRRLPLLQLH